MSSDNELLHQPDTLQQKPTGSFRFALTLPIWVVLPLLGLFPPAAWYYLKKEKRRHQFFTILLYLYGGLIFISTSFYEFFLRPQIAKILAKHSQSAPLDTPIGSIFIILVMVYAVAQIVLGMLMIRVSQKYNSLPSRWLWGIAVIFILDTILFLFLPAIVVAWLLLGLYNLTA